MLYQISWNLASNILYLLLYAALSFLCVRQQRNSANIELSTKILWSLESLVKLGCLETRKQSSSKHPEICKSGSLVLAVVKENYLSTLQLKLITKGDSRGMSWSWTSLENLPFLRVKWWPYPPAQFLYTVKASTVKTVWTTWESRLRKVGEMQSCASTRD